VVCIVLWPRGQSFGLTGPRYQNFDLGLVTLTSAKDTWPLLQC